MVQKGTTKGNVNFIVGGVTAILLGVVMMVLEFYLRDVAASWPRPVYTATRAAGEGRAAPPSADALKLARLQAAINEGGSSPAAASPSSDTLTTVPTSTRNSRGRPSIG